MNSVPDSPERERLLWLSVIRQAQLDSEGRGEIDPKLQRLAQWWLTNITSGFLTVCCRAGLMPSEMHGLQEQQRKKFGMQPTITVDEYFKDFESFIDSEES